MSPIQFQVVDAFIKWSISGFNGKFESFVDESNPVKQAWKGLFYVLVLFALILLFLRLF